MEGRRLSKRLELLYDFTSSPSYLAWTQLPGIARDAAVELIMTPVLAGGIFKASGNPSPLDVPAKARWIAGDVALWADFHGVAYRSTPYFPIRSLPLLRGSLVAAERGESDAYVRCVFEAIWVHEADMNDPAVIEATLGRAGLDAGAYVAEFGRQEIKDRLRWNTDDAVARGAFGVPTIFVGERMFFGQDRLHFVRAALRDA